MKIKLLSDLHMEGFQFQYEYHGEDAIVLAGDIHTRNRHHLLLDQINPDIPVYFVAGNHEYYHQEFRATQEYFIALEGEYNFTWLNNQATSFDDIAIFGSTMFTNFNLYGETERWFTVHAAQSCIADFYQIETNNGGFNRRWNPVDHENEFNKFVDAFVLWLRATEGKKRIVITHFMPTEQLTHKRFKASQLNPYFTQNMEQYMGWEGYWFCGHGHDSKDIMVGDTRIVMNPKGYGNENPDFNAGMILEI
jgi:hypothetical protein